MSGVRVKDLQPNLRWALQQFQWSRGTFIRGYKLAGLVECDPPRAWWLQRLHEFEEWKGLMPGAAAQAVSGDECDATDVSPVFQRLVVEGD